MHCARGDLIAYRSFLKADTNLMQRIMSYMKNSNKLLRCFKCLSESESEQIGSFICRSQVWITLSWHLILSPFHEQMIPILSYQHESKYMYYCKEDLSTKFDQALYLSTSSMLIPSEVIPEHPRRSSLHRALQLMLFSPELDRDNSFLSSRTSSSCWPWVMLMTPKSEMHGEQRQSMLWGNQHEGFS